MPFSQPQESIPPDGEGLEHNFAVANRTHFDERAQGIEDSHPEAPELARREVRAMRKAWPDLFDEDSTVAMDYACGTGTCLRELLA